MAVRGTRWRNAGFTLIEILVVLVILGLLLGLVGPRVLRYLDSAKVDTTRLQIESLGAALDLYRLDAGRYPTQSEGLAVLIERPDGARRWNGPFLKGKEMPTDPWDRRYLYRFPGERGGDYDLYSLGADGVEGGEKNFFRSI